MRATGGPTSRKLRRLVSTAGLVVLMLVVAVSAAVAMAVLIDVIG